MKEYTKNQNEYRVDGKLYVEKIKSCKVREKRNGLYAVECRIHQRGVHWYYCGNEPEYLNKEQAGRGKKFWLSESAKETVAAVIEGYEKLVAAAKAESITVSVKLSDEIGLNVQYKHKAENKYDFVTEIYLNGTLYSQKYTYGQRLKEMLHQLHYIHIDSGLRGTYDCEKEYRIIFEALYDTAGKHGDDLMQLEMKLLNNTADEDECRRLSELLGVKILLPKKNTVGIDEDGEPTTKEYAVIKETVNFSLLHNSGYTFLHRPLFAMIGSTRDNITIDPANRCVVDAAKENMEAVTFEEFLKLIADESIEEK